MLCAVLQGSATANAALAAANVAAAVENMVATGTEGASETAVAASAAPGATAVAAAAPVVPQPAPAPPLRKAKTKEGKGKAGPMWCLSNKRGSFLKVILVAHDLILDICVLLFDYRFFRVLRSERS